MDPFSVISFKSFDAFWYWIMMGVSWSLMCHWTLGVPFDGLSQAHRRGGEAADMVDELASVYVRRMTDLVESAGVYILGFACFLIAVVGTFGFFYGYELAQAFFMLVVPLMIVQGLNTALAFKVRRNGLSGAELRARLFRRRFWNQVIGLTSIAVTAGIALFNFSKNISWL